MDHLPRPRLLPHVCTIYYLIPLKFEARETGSVLYMSDCILGLFYGPRMLYGLFIGYYKIARVTTGNWVKIRPPHSPVVQFGIALTKSHARDKESGLDVATRGVANATSFYSVATKFSRLVANLAPKIGDFLLWVNVH